MNYKDIFFNAPNPMAIVTQEGKILDSNKAFNTLLGYNSDELAETDINNIIKDKKKLNLKTAGQYKKYQFIHKNEQIIKMDTKISDVDHNNFILNIEQSIKKEVEKNEHLFLGALMEELPSHYYFKNKNSEFLLVSKNMIRHFGMAHDDDVIGKTDFDIFSEPHARRAYEEEQTIIKTGKAKINFVEKETWPDGSVRWVLSSKFPFKDETGTIIGIVGESHNITKQKLQEKEITEKTNILNAITSKMPIVIFKFSIQEGITSLFGSTQMVEAFYNSKVARLNVADSLSNFTEKIKNQKLSQRYYNFPSTYHDNDEEWHFNNYLFEAQNEQEEYIGLALEVSEKKIAEQTLKRNTRNLEKINKELNQFAYIISHDLKSPLRAITTLSEWIEDDLADLGDDDVKDNLQLLRKRVKRLENLINGILSYSRASRATLEFKEIDAKKLLEKVVEIIDIPDNFTINLPENASSIYFTESGFQQIFVNLITNAIKHHDKPKGNINIEYNDKEKWHEFTVSDDGPGIEELYHEKIFQIFQTLQARDSFESTGIGLTIVKKIIEEHGGCISIESEKNKGAKFTIHIPKNCWKQNN